MHPPACIPIPPRNMSHIQLAAPPPNETNEHSASKLAPSKTPLLAQRLQTLFEASEPRSAEAAHVIVIAVDGLERSPVQELLSLLSNYVHDFSQKIIPHKPSNVRVYPGLPIRDSHPSIQPIHHWDVLWKHFSDEMSDRDQIHIIIVGFAPLMAMMKVSALCPVHDIYAEQANWDRLAHEWHGSIQPDITIIVQQYDGCIVHPTILPVHETETLMVPQVSERGQFLTLQLDLLQAYIKHWLKELLRLPP
jgi:hypothetical protein